MEKHRSGNGKRLRNIESYCWLDEFCCSGGYQYSCSKSSRPVHHRQESFLRLYKLDHRYRLEPCYFHWCQCFPEH